MVLPFSTTEDSWTAFLAPSGAQGVTLSVCLSVRLSGTKWSKALNLHLSLITQSQVSLRSVSGLSVPTLSDRRSLKYFVLFYLCSWISIYCSLSTLMPHDTRFAPRPESWTQSRLSELERWMRVCSAAVQRLTLLSWLRGSANFQNIITK